MSQAKLADARKRFEEAEAWIRVTWLQWYPDWINATFLYEKAGSGFRQCKEFELAIEAYKKAADGQVILNSKWQAGRHLETAGTLSAELLKWNDAKLLFRNAVDYYVESGTASPHLISDALLRIARLLEGPEPEAALELYVEACGVLEERGDSNGGDGFRSTAALFLKLERFQEAAGVYLKFGHLSKSQGSPQAMNKAYLSAIIIFLASRSFTDARTCLNGCIEEDSFLESSQCEVAEKLVHLVKTGDVDSLMSIVKGSLVSNLDSMIVRLAMRLPQMVAEGGLKKASVEVVTGRGTADEDCRSDDENFT